MTDRAVAALIEMKLRRQAEDDFYTFVQQAWHIVEPGSKFQGGWALKAICLPYNSEIITEDGPMPIGYIVESGYNGNVLSFCHKSNSLQWKPIKHKMKSPGLPLYNLILNTGKKLTITGNHPVFVKGKGYARAENIREGDVVLQAMRKKVSPQSFSGVRRILQQAMFWRFKNSSRKSYMPCLRRKNRMGKQEILQKMLRCITKDRENPSLWVLRKSNLSLTVFFQNVKIQARAILQSKMFHKQAFRGKLFGLYRWSLPNQICSQLSYSPQESFKKGWKLLFHLFGQRENGCSPYRQKQNEQRVMESGNIMPPMSQSSKGNTRADFEISKSYVVSIEHSLRIPESVYNIEVGDNNNYFAQGILVHNCAHLEEVYYGRIKRLLINQPPRTGKSSLISVLWPVWVWIKNPAEQFICVSYAESLAKRDNVKARRLIKSKWFQTRWPHLILTDDQDTKNYVENTLGGHRYVTGCDGAVTGFGGNIVICDDLNSVRDSSETMLESAQSFFTDVLPTRFNDFKTGRMVVVQQRTDTKDISGWILAHQSKEFVALILPMEFEESRRCVTVPLKYTNGEPWQDPRTEEGELLWPERFGEKELKLLKSALSSEYMIAGQLQQRPAPSEGGMIKRAWWQPWKHEEPPTIRFVIQAWDTAMSIKDKSAYSACTTFGMFKDDHQHDALILLGAWRKRVEFPELYKAVQRMARDYRATSEDRPVNPKYAPDLVLVEEKASGIQLIQTLNKTGIVLVGWRPDKYGDKVERVRRVTHLLEAGRVYVPYRGPDFTKPKKYADFLITQAALFPKGDGADLVDCCTMTLQRVINSGWILHPLEQSAAQQNEWRREYIGQEDKGFY